MDNEKSIVNGGGNVDIDVWKKVSSYFDDDGTFIGKQSRLDGAYHLLDPFAIQCIANVLKVGGEKYGLFNWHHIPIVEHLDHALFHIFSYLREGESKGEGEGEDHLSHAATRLMFALALREHKKVGVGIETYLRHFIRD